MTARTHLDSIFRAERALRDAEALLLSTDDSASLAALLTDAVREAKTLPDTRESTTRLERLADLCAQVEGPSMVDTLIEILDNDEPVVRVAAGEALLDVGYDRYAEVARAIERALDKKHDGPAMSELPWILSEIGEPSALKLIGRFLEQKDAEIVASAIEALAALGQPEGAALLQKLTKDKRTVSMEDGDEHVTATIGELAEEAIDALG